MAAPWFERKLIAAEPLYDLAKVGKLDRTTSIQNAILGISLSGSPAALESFARYLNFKAAREMARQVPFYPPREEQLYAHLGAGEFIGFGHCENGMAFVVPVNSLTEHGVVTGATGTGKTTLLTLTALQAMKHCASIIVDREKEDYRHFAKSIGMLVLNAQKDFVWNPLEVHEGITPEQALTTVIMIMAKSFGWLIGSQSEAATVLHQLFIERGVFGGGKNFPTLYEFRDAVAARKHRAYGRAAGYQDSIVNRLDAMLLEAPRTYSYSKGFPISELANRSFVLEVKGLSEQHARFLVTHLLYTLFLYRIRKGERGNVLRNLCIIDEASWLAPPGYNENLGFSPLSQIMRQSREAGLGLFMASQTAQLDDGVFENTRLKMTFRLGHGKDVESVAKAMRLSKEQADYIAKLQTGECIVRIPGVEPFLLTVPRV